MSSPSKKVQLVGFKNFVRHNPMSDRFDVRHFHHVEFYCGDATNTSKRFQWGLGLNLVAKSDQSTGNHEGASYVTQSNDVTIVFTAPYALETEKDAAATFPLPGFDMVRCILYTMYTYSTDRLTHAVVTFLHCRNLRTSSRRSTGSRSVRSVSQSETRKKRTTRL